MKELTKTKLHNILKKYNQKLEQHDKAWSDLCRKKCKQEVNGDRIIMTTPSIYDHEQHNSRGNQLFKALMAELNEYEVFPSKKK